MVGEYDMWGDSYFMIDMSGLFTIDLCWYIWYFGFLLRMFLKMINLYFMHFLLQ